MNETLFVALRQGFPADLDRTAVELADGPNAGRAWTWRELERGSARLASFFDDLGLPAGGRVVVHTDKCVEGLVLYLAVLRAGLVYVPLNPAYQAAELAHFLADAAPSLVVCSSKNRAWIEALLAGGEARTEGPRLFTLDEDGGGTLFAAAANAPETQAPVLRTADELAAIVYTSGTTGRSKGAMLTHSNLVSNARVLDAHWGWRHANAPHDGDVLVHALPFFHVHGLFVACHGALLSGSKMLWFARFDAAVVTRRLPEATVFMGVPTLYVRLLAEPTFGREACRRMRLFLAGSAPLLRETFEAFRARTGHAIVERYGMSETLMLTSNPYLAGEDARRAGTVGLPLPGVAVRIVGSEGRPVDAGEIGGVEVCGPSVFRGYWRLPDKTREDFTADGWFKTGDVGKRDADGYLTLVGRSKDLVISGGYNVYPAEVEGYLDALPGVAESAVIGVPHPDFGEGVVAVLVPRPGVTLDLQVLIATLKGQIAGFKVPKRCFVTDALPRNAMGKVQKNVLRDQHRDAFRDARD